MNLHLFPKKRLRELPDSRPTAYGEKPVGAVAVQTAARRGNLLPGRAGPYLQELRLYDALREAIPVVDASLQKIIRLTGGFGVTCGNAESDRALARFLREVPVGGASLGLESFVRAYLDDLLAYGNAVGEIVLSRDGRHIAGLYNGSLHDIEIRPGKNPLQSELWVRDGLSARAVTDRARTFFTALNPRPGELTGQSLLRGLPFVAETLCRIFEATGKNFERIGNLRYAITYKPQGGELDRAAAGERARQIAEAWGQGMEAAQEGRISDFICVGDVSVQAIGTDGQLLSTEVPVRQLLEQIIAKLGVPPFLLGLSWSTTERMSRQQADILTSELACYRRLLAPVILKICETFLRLEGLRGEPELAWSIINLQDEGEMAKARLNNAQADRILNELPQRNGGKS